MQNRKHYAAALMAFVIWGFFPIPLRGLIDYTSGQILYFRILFSFAVLAIVLLGFRRDVVADNISRFQNLPAADRKRVILLTVAGGALLTFNWLIFIYIVNHVNVKTASFSYLICPVITAVLGYIILSERLTSLQWIAVGLCAVSCVLVGFNSVRELGFSVVTALTYALYLISQRRNQGFDRLVILGIQVTISLTVLSTVTPWLVSEVPAEPYFFSVITLIAVVFTVLPLFLNLFALNKINSATIGIMMYMNPLINFTIAFVIYQEQTTALQAVGYVIIALALVMFNYQVFRKFSIAS